MEFFININMDELKKYLGGYLKIKYMLSEHSLLLFTNGCLLSWEFLEKVKELASISHIQIGDNVVNIIFNLKQSISGILPIEEYRQVTINIPKFSDTDCYTIVKKGKEIEALHS